MVDNLDIREGDQSFDVEVRRALEDGVDYEKAFLNLDLRLAHINPEERALLIDVGRGPEAIAAKRLGFKKAIITNSTSAGYQFALPSSAQREQDILNRVCTEFPPDSHIGSLNVADLLRIGSLSARLITMLKLAPGYFGEEGREGEYLKSILRLSHKLTPGGIMILSALNDHPSSLVAFEQASAELGSNKVSHELLIDDSIPENLKCLGDRILTINNQ